MFIKMLKLKRRVMQPGLMESWLDWHIRSFRKASDSIRKFDCDILTTLDTNKRSWAGHLVRLGLPKGGVETEKRVLKSVLFWRPLAWWRDQQWFNDLNWMPVRHPQSVGQPKRWEGQFSTNWPLALV